MKDYIGKKVYFSSLNKQLTGIIIDFDDYSLDRLYQVRSLEDGGCNYFLCEHEFVLVENELSKSRNKTIDKLIKRVKKINETLVVHYCSKLSDLNEIIEDLESLRE